MYDISATSFSDLKSELGDFKQIVSQEKILAPIRKLGGEIYLRQAEYFKELQNGNTLHPLDVYSFVHHFICLSQELSSAKSENYFISDAVIDSVFTLRKLASEWRQNYIDTPIFNQAAYHAATIEFFKELKQAYTKLMYETTLKHIANAESLNLTLLEFDTEFSGIPEAILPCIFELEQNLLIDTQLNKKQDGYLRALDIDELRDFLRRRQSRLFAMFEADQLICFIMPNYNTASSTDKIGELRTHLLQSGIITEGQNIAWCEEVGSAKASRLKLAYAGINSYKVVDQFMTSVAVSENIDLLLAAVREGSNANAAKKAHERLGWKTTDVTFLGIDQKTPYRLLIRPITPNTNSAFAVLNPKPKIGEGSHFELYQNHFAPREVELEQARAIKNSTAVAICNEALETCLLPRFEVLPCQSDLAFHIRIRVGNLYYTLHQVRPNTDYWHYYHYRREDTGSLEKLLPLIIKDILY